MMRKFILCVLMACLIIVFGVIMLMVDLTGHPNHLVHEPAPHLVQLLETPALPAFLQQRYRDFGSDLYTVPRIGGEPAITSAPDTKIVFDAEWSFGHVKSPLTCSANGSCQIDVYDATIPSAPIHLMSVVAMNIGVVSASANGPYPRIVTNISDNSVGATWIWNAATQQYLME